MNSGGHGSSGFQRSAGFRGRRPRAQLHEGRRETGRRAVDAQPHDQAPGIADGPAASHAHDPKRRPDRGRRAASAIGCATHGGDRARYRRADVPARQAVGHHPDHARGPCPRKSRLAEAGTGPDEISRHQGRVQRRHGFPQHRRRRLRCRHTSRRERRERHDRGAHRSGLAARRSRLAGLSERASEAEASAGPAEACLHQAARGGRRSLCMGVCQKRSRPPGAGRGATDLQRLSAP